MTTNQDAFLKNYNRLNSKQKYAVDNIDGPSLVIAGPGSGKTQILSMRVANILRQTDAIPQSILCLTFTDAAAKNMLQRLVDTIGIDAYKINIHTFHSFATDIIGKYPEIFFMGVQFMPLEEIARVEILENLFSNLDYKDKLSSKHPELGWVYKKDVECLIKDLKSAGILPDEFRSILRENYTFLCLIEAHLQDLFSIKITRKTIDLMPAVIDKISEEPYKSDHAPRINTELPNFILGNVECKETWRFFGDIACHLPRQIGFNHRKCSEQRQPKAKRDHQPSRLGAWAVEVRQRKPWQRSFWPG